MNDAAILDLGVLPQYAPPAHRRRVSLWLLGGILTVLAVLLAVSQFSNAFGLRSALAVIGMTEPARPDVIRIDFSDLQKIGDLNVDDKSQIIVEGIDAQQRNAAIPVSQLPIENAASFHLTSAYEGAFGNALRCLTQAVYYEAGFEPEAGKRAVAQVVLNRMRHPAYPNSVCGVVYQGSTRTTGCQFSFTCDGALLRAPAIGPWRAAQAVAAAALAGHVETSVGTATHYHADYVLPKWAFQLAKIGQIGRHIFYRFNGSWGATSAFNGHYSGLEQIPELNLAALRERALMDQTPLPADGLVPGLTVTPDVSDRHAEADVGGRLDVTKEWRLSIPDPVHASAHYREIVGDADAVPTAEKSHVAAGEPSEAAVVQ